MVCYVHGDCIIANIFLFVETFSLQKQKHGFVLFNMKAVIEITVDLKDRVKEVAKKQGCSVKQLATYIVRKGVEPFENGELQVQGSKLDVSSNEKGGE